MADLDYCDACSSLTIDPPAVTDAARAATADAIAHELEVLRPMLDALLAVVRVGSGANYGSPYAISLARSTQAGAVRDAMAHLEKAVKELERCAISAREEDEKVCSCGDTYIGAGYGGHCTRQCYHAPLPLPKAVQR